MSLGPGTRLGPYEIVSALGAGGMGEVYRARDSKLNREVALKVLPDSFVNDPDRLARFTREAQTLASLNHPNIAHIHGLEESGPVADPTGSGQAGSGQGAVRALVMELVEGDDLSQRIARGALPLDEALPIARQIAEALEAAHEQGIIHRDLKPANIKVRPDGVVKVLDFGLAKALDPMPASGAEAMNSPTFTRLRQGYGEAGREAGTAMGMILGTAAYMAPEQAKGRPVDRRADVWAFGCVLYEMLTGARAFAGEDVSETLASVLKTDPEWSALPAETPIAIRRLLGRCLEKDFRRRLQAIGDARLEIDDALAGASAHELPLPSAPGRPRWRLGTVLVLGALACAALGGALAWNLRRPAASGPARVSRLAVTLTPGDDLDATGGRSLVLSQDGTELAYLALRGGVRRIFLRSLDSLESRPLAGTENAQSPFFSPDGRWIGFFAGGKLKKIPASGGASEEVCEAPGYWGGAWAPNDVIYFTTGPMSPLWQVPAKGGTRQPFTTLNRERGEVSHRWPQVLPGGAAVLFTVWTGPGNDETHVHLQTLQGERRELVRGGHTGAYVAGHLIYDRRGTLMAVPFDVARLEAVDRPPVIVGEGVLENAEVAEYAASDTGVLAWLPGRPNSSETNMVWVDRSGLEAPVPIQARAYQNPRLSPDAQRVAFSVTEGQIDLWVYDFVRGVASRLQADGSSQAPAWTPDGQRLAYRATRRGTRNLFWRMADGSGTEERLTTGEGSAAPGEWTRDGAELVYSNTVLTTGSDIWILDRRDGRARPLVQTRFDEMHARFSPDGRWLAYSSNESGRYEVYVQAYPVGGARSQISTDGGWEPVWNPNGRELFYRSEGGHRMMAASIATAPRFSPGTPTRLFEGQFRTQVAATANYDVSPDGQRFLMVAERNETPRQINVALNWIEELKAKVPAK